MPTTVKDMLAAARAAAPTSAWGGGFFGEDRRGRDRRCARRTEVAASGKIKGALAISRGLLEFKADPDLPTHEPGAAEGSSCRYFTAPRVDAPHLLENAPRPGITDGAWGRVQGTGWCRSADGASLT